MSEGQAGRRLRGRVGPARFWWGLLAGVLVVGTLAAAWFLLPVRVVTVTGTKHLSIQQVRALAGLGAPFTGVKRPGGWLFYGAWRASALRASAWVQSAQLVRRFPGTVEVRVTERVPAARWQRPDGAVAVIAWDGTVLPGAAPVGPLLSGWGPDRLPLARAVAQAFGRVHVEAVSYSPSGITVKTATATVWSGNMNSLLKYSGSVKMFAGKRINMYPWGVSVQQ